MKDLEPTIVKVFSIFAATYGGRWTLGRESIGVWAAVLEEATAQELVQASLVWARTDEWPPTPAGLLSRIPRFCKCGKCPTCHHRAVERAGRALERGSAGATFDTSEAALVQQSAIQSVLERTVRTALPQAPNPRAILDDDGED